MPLSASDVATLIDQLPPALRAAIEGVEHENERLRERVEELARENGFDACRAEEEQENAARAKAETQRAEQEQARLTALCKTYEHELAELATKRDAAEGRVAILLERARMLEADVAAANDARAKVEATLRLRDYELAECHAIIGVRDDIRVSRTSDIVAELRGDGAVTVTSPSRAMGPLDVVAVSYCYGVGKALGEELALREAELATLTARFDEVAAELTRMRANYEEQLADVRSGAEHLRRAVIQLARSNQAFMGIDGLPHEARAGEVVTLLEELWQREKERAK